MARIIEPLLTEVLWSELESRGFTVYGEVSLPDAGRVDLYAVTPNGTRWGIEVKNHWSLIPWGARDRDEPTSVAQSDDPIKPSKLRELTKQLDKYANSGYCDELYVATQGPKALLRAIDDEDVWQEWRNDRSLAAHQLFGKGKWGDVEPPSYIGAIRVTPFAPSDVDNIRVNLPSDIDRPQPVEVERHPTPITDGNDERQVPPTVTTRREKPISVSESDFAHEVWEFFNQNTRGPVLREPVLPNPDSTKVQRTDIMTFSGVGNPTRIYNRQNKNEDSQGIPEDDVEYAVQGYEVKTQITENVKGQLARYIDSGGVNKLWLVVPPEKESDATDLIIKHDETLSDVGLLVYDGTNTPTIYRHPTMQPLEYPTIKLSRNTHSVSTIGWGLAWTQQDQPLQPVWDQENQTGLHCESDPSERNVAELNWTENAKNADGYADNDTSLTFVECTSCGAMSERDPTGRRCPNCSKPLIRMITQSNVRRIGEDEYGNTVYTKITKK